MNVVATSDFPYRGHLFPFEEILPAFDQPPFVASSSAQDRSFIFSSSIFLTLTKEFLLHSVSFSPHVCNFPATSSIVAPIIDGPQALVTVLLHPLSRSHIF